MFGSKKKSLSPRPKIPNVEDILEDLSNCTSVEDVAFKLLSRDSVINNTYTVATSEMHELNSTYEKIKANLDVSKKLIDNRNLIIENEKKLESSVNNMKELTEEIKEQAKAALIQ